MLLRMVGTDVRRNVTVTVTLVVLMMLSVMMASASAGLLARLAGAGDRLLTVADAPHVGQMHAGPLDEGELAAWAGQRPDVAHHQVQLLLGVDNAQLIFDGVPQTDSIQQNSFVVANTERDLFTDLAGHRVTDVESGTIWLPVIYRVENGLEPGATVTVTGPEGYRQHFVIAGFFRDAIMNTGIASSKRLAISAADLAELQAHTGTSEYLISFWLHDPAGGTAAFKKAYLDAGMPSIGPMLDSSAFRLFNMISEGLVAAVVILAAVLLMIVGLLCLRLSFLAAVHTDQREIGVLTAIGVPPGGIKRIYLTKYGVIGLCACVAGLVGGWALAPVMSRSLAVYLGDVEGPAPWLVPAVVAVAVFGVIVLFILSLLRRFNTLSAVEALRAGSVGTRSAGPRLSLHRSVLPTTITMGLIDLVKRPVMYLLLLVVFAVSAFIVVVPTSAATTLGAPSFPTQMGVGEADLALNLQYVDDTTAAEFSAAVDGLAADPDVAEFVALTSTRHDLTTAEGERTSLFVAHGDHLTLPVTYADGRAPVNDREIALSLLALADSGHRVGDTVTLDVAGRPRELLIVGSYQDITNGGKTARAMLPADSGDIMWYSFALTVRPGVDIDTKAAEYQQAWPSIRPWKMSDFTAQQLGPISRQINQAAALSALVAVALAVLMTAMFTRMLLAGDNTQIAIQRGIGVSDSDIRVQYLTRILVVLALGVPIGIGLALTLGQSMFNLMFEGMFGGIGYLFRGTSRIEFITSPALTALALPAVLITAVALATVASFRTITRTGVASLVTE